MVLQRPSSRGSEGVSTVVVHRLLGQEFEPGTDEAPSALVLMLLLGPDDLGVRVLGEDFLDLRLGEGSELLDSDDGDVLSNKWWYIEFFLLLCVLELVEELP